MVATVDGKATLLQAGHRGPIGSAVDRAIMVRLRLHADAVLRGAATVRHNPRYPGVPQAVEELRRQRGLAGQPLACTVSATGHLQAGWPFFRQAPRLPVVFVGPGCSPEDERQLREVAEVHRAPAPGHGEGPPQPPGGRGAGEAGGAVPVDWMLRVLRERHGVRWLLCEGGPTLNFHLFRGGCVDELFLTVTPRVAGGRGELTAVAGDSFLVPPARLELLSAFLHEDELFLRYRVRQDPPPGPGPAPAAVPGAASGPAGT